mmetsp:Transcript_11918/g.28873  ORF Transcript_11918/g.28873 Transcript_11918/m.28873 type:complete len:246 (-) Transcript_11918:231-968(-)
MMPTLPISVTAVQRGALHRGPRLVERRGVEAVALGARGSRLLVPALRRARSGSVLRASRAAQRETAHWSHSSSYSARVPDSGEHDATLRRLARRLRLGQARQREGLLHQLDFLLQQTGQLHLLLLVVVAKQVVGVGAALEHDSRARGGRGRLQIAAVVAAVHRRVWHRGVAADRNGRRRGGGFVVVCSSGCVGRVVITRVCSGCWRRNGGLLLLLDTRGAGRRRHVLIEALIGLAARTSLSPHRG